MRKVIFLGSNPPENSGTTAPFANCASGVLLKKWINYMGLDENDYEIHNVHNLSTPKNRPLTVKEIDSNAARIDNLTVDKIVIPLGASAKKLFDRHFLMYFNRYILSDLPHPSPLNRKLNSYPNRIPEALLDNSRKEIYEIWVSDI